MKIFDRKQNMVDIGVVFSAIIVLLSVRLVESYYWWLAAIVLGIGLIVYFGISSYNQSQLINTQGGLPDTQEMEKPFEIALAIALGILSLGVSLLLFSGECRGDGIGCIVMIIPYTIGLLTPSLLFGLWLKCSFWSRVAYASVVQIIVLLYVTIVILENNSLIKFYGFLGSFSTWIILLVALALNLLSIAFFDTIGKFIVTVYKKNK